MDEAPTGSERHFASRLRADPPAPLGRVLRGRRLPGFESRPFRKRLCGCGRGRGGRGLWAPAARGWRSRGQRAGRSRPWSPTAPLQPGRGSQVRESAPRAPTRRLQRAVLPRDPESAQGRRGSALGSQKVRRGDGGSLRGPRASVYRSHPRTDRRLPPSGRPRPAPPRPGTTAWPRHAQLRSEQKNQNKNSPGRDLPSTRAPAHRLAAPHPVGPPATAAPAVHGCACPGLCERRGGRGWPSQASARGAGLSAAGSPPPRPPRPQPGGSVSGSPAPLVTSRGGSPDARAVAASRLR